MQQRDVSLRSKRFGSAAMVINVELQVQINVKRFEQELFERVNRISGLPRMVCVVTRDGEYPNGRVYSVALPYLSLESLEKVTGVIEQIEQEILDVKRQQYVLSLLEV